MQQEPSPAALPRKRPVILLILWAVLVVLGVLFTPSVLIKLGPMRGSLTHPNPMVRRTTMLEVNFLRIACLVSAFVLLMIYAAWDRFRTSRFVAGVLERPLSEYDHARQRRVFNSSLVIMLAGLVVWLVYVKIGHHVFSPWWVSEINREDGVVEGGTALFFLVASVVAAILAFKVRGKPAKAFALFLAFGFFMCMGEEMSWGQRIFGWKTPESMAKVNVQAETNLHNLSGYFADHVFIAGTLLYGGVLPFVAARSRVWRRVFDHFGVIVGSLGLAVGFILVTLNQPYVIDPLLGRAEHKMRDRSGDKSKPLAEDFRPGDNPIRVQEGREMLSGLGYMLLMLEALRARRRMAGVDEEVDASTAPAASPLSATR
jgi:hypothetical protein